MTFSCDSSDSLAQIDRTLDHALTRLRSLSRRDVQAEWRSPRPEGDDPQSHGLALTPRMFFQGDGASGEVVPLNGRQHIAWGRGRRVLWLWQRLIWPEQVGGGYSVAGLSAKLALRWWADGAEIYVDGTLVHGGDIFDCWTRVTVAEAVIPGTSVEVALKLTSPDHDEGALVTSELVFESLDETYPEPAFVADEVAVLATYLRSFAPENLAILGTALSDLAWDRVSDRPQFHRSLNQMRDRLRSFTPWIKQRQIHCIGHAHLDLAWLWPVAETWEAAERTFSSVLALQTEFPELTFTHSSPALFDWLEAHHPDLFAAIQAQVKAGRWAIDAGLWVEPDLNLPGGEALVRQILYGQRYCAEKFGAVSEIAWLPDTFGFNWQLPQLLTQGGVRYFATQKLRWNDSNPFPYDLFTWQGLDGTPLTGVTLPPIGTDIDPMAIAQYAAQWEASTGLLESLWLPGVGDHGGGPTRDMLMKARRWANSPLFPRITFGHAQPLLDRLLSPPSSLEDAPQGVSPTTLPRWNDELYLELHRGCYTTHGDQKQANRRCEDLLFQAELWSTMAYLLAQHPYPRADLETAWKQVLFNQFHDILPGSSIPEVFADANATWQVVWATGQRIVQESLAALTAALPQPTPPPGTALAVVLFNPLNWERDGVVAIPLPQPWADYPHWQAWDGTGQALPVQWCADGLGATVADPAAMAPTPEAPPDDGPRPSVLLAVKGVPSVGYRRLWLVPLPDGRVSQPSAHSPSAPAAAWVLENPYLTVTLDPNTGEIASLIHRATNTETLRAPGNQLQAFTDAGQYWDAWNIAPDYADHPLAGFELVEMAWVEDGPCRQVVRVVKTFNRSTFVQDYVLEVTAPYLTLRTEVDWQETQVLVKVAFPLTVTAPQATYEIPFGAIQRTTDPQTPLDRAKWEVPALRWADISQGDGPMGRGVSLLTDYKHGFDATPDQIRITLLKAPLWPDPTADRGRQTFTYALYPHGGTWQSAQTVQQARNLNLPLRPWVAEPTDLTPAVTSPTDAPTQTLPAAQSFLGFGETTWVISALKLAEEGNHQVILRGYESTGNPTTLSLDSCLGLTDLVAVTLLEQPTSPMDTTGDRSLTLAPWQVTTVIGTVGAD